MFSWLYPSSPRGDPDQRDGNAEIREDYQYDGDTHYHQETDPSHDVVERVVVAGQCIGWAVVTEEALYHQRATEGEASYEANSEGYQSQREQPQYY